ncbi:ATP-dependent DNA helicase RecG [Salinibacterium sp. G-O1]|uniref:ATP-dependent DNA helicase RecG n=1 Tax=Salinibacterium sp. G-O1 TaxID=3046208 RepID=UPI0024B95BCF|nr:ATP-dependent DNA helicase RecG [Salinibacterium sp. G-O1]MDJ0335759.1 ATP-dependent DNA helicase RecG [Salinibacterium sp. G-O1]
MASPLDQKLAVALGGRTSAAFAKGLGLETVGDLLSHYPRRYARRGELTALTHLPVDENVTIVAEVLRVMNRPMRAKRGSILEVTIGDGKGILTLTFFNQAWRATELKAGARGIFTGKVGDYRGNLQLAHPDYELFDDDVDSADPERVKAWAELPIPIYAATATVASWQVQKAIGVVLDTLPQLDDPVPDAVRSSLKLMDFSRALQLVHRPTIDAEWGGARKSLRFQEAFVLQVALLQQRLRLRETAATPRVAGPLLDGFDAALPFTLTGDQALVGLQIADDLAAPVPMNRLVQGEVGSGKTLVALRAMLTVAESGGQSALLAPTEVLAHQHLRSIVKTLGPDLAARLRPTVLTGQLPVAQRRKAMLAAVSGSAHIVIGTHALLADRVEFFDLGLVVVDEQHRFGVEQREALRLKGRQPPHALVLTATPIPRTVAMTVFGDLDISTIAELPAGRSPIESFVVPLAEHPGWVSRVWARVAEELAKGHQAFVVCPAIDATPTDDGDLPAPDAVTSDAPATRAAANVTEVLASLRSNAVLAGKRIEALHGRMSGDEKDEIMRAFAAGSIDVIVATTVIEVGVDVPNASTMVVLDADRFGVSQLHQLRGRVGRGGVQGLALFVTNAEQESLARERVEAVASTLDGFELANKDLELRQEGDVLGSSQSGGRSSLRLVRVAKDGALIADARERAAAVLDADPTLAAYPALREALERRLDETSESFLAKN